jgi:hypothetical protein
VAAEAALVHAAVGSAVEGETHVLQLEHGVDGVAGEDFGGVLVDEVVAALDGVEHVPLPVVFFDVAEGGGDPALGGARVGAGGVELADDGDVGLAGHLDGRHQPGAAGADDDRVVSVISHPVLRPARAVSGLRVRMLTARMRPGMGVRMGNLASVARHVKRRVARRRWIHDIGRNWPRNAIIRP